MVLNIRRAFVGFAHYVFFGNYFYGICAIALCMEAAYQQDIPLNSGLFYLFIFCFTVLYYTKAYITEKKTGSNNPRSNWYWQHRSSVYISQILLVVFGSIYPIYLLFTKSDFLLSMPVLLWSILLVFPVSAILYYGISHPLISMISLRNIGWLKPFLIGFVWAGLVTVYPFVFAGIEKEIIYQADWPLLFLFTKNFMFVTVLCIMFDIKDYAADHNRQLKTFVVKAGLRNTLFLILMPLCLLGLGAYLLYGNARGFSSARILMNVVPFLLLLLVTYSMHRRKSIFYYLVVIDGLMLVKAVCGILGTMI